MRLIMTSTEEEWKATLRKEICSVANKDMDIEPEDNFSKDVTYCLKHKYLTKGEYWLGSVESGELAHNGIRIHKVHTWPCPRRNFVDLFKCVKSFNDSQSRYIAKTIAYLIEFITPIEQDMADLIRDSHVRKHREYCYNYYTSESHEQYFYVSNGFIKFHNEPLSEHVKIHFNSYLDGYHIIKNINFYLMGDDLICSTNFGDKNYVIVNRNENFKILACAILNEMIQPLLENIDYGYNSITPENVKNIFSRIAEFKQVNSMVEI